MCTVLQKVLKVEIFPEILNQELQLRVAFFVFNSIYLFVLQRIRCFPEKTKATSLRV